LKFVIRDAERLSGGVIYPPVESLLAATTGRRCTLVAAGG
jgi:hypothetical protein